MLNAKDRNVSSCLFSSELFDIFDKCYPESRVNLVFQIGYSGNRNQNFFYVHFMRSQTLDAFE